MGRRRLRHAQHRLAAGAARAGPAQQEAQVEILESLEVFPSTLPTKRDSAYAAWVSISVGCNNTCTFCIVPSLRGKEKDRRPGEMLAEVEALVAEGVSEVTLLGQNVNTYGVEFGDRLAFGKLLRACGEIEGLERVRFTSPHPASFTDDVIAAMAETPNVMPQLHMPLQSGSSACSSDAPVLPAGALPRHPRRRSATAMPDAAITTDIIVGFPGETEEDFLETMRCRRAGALRLGLHLPVLQPAGHAGRDDARPGPGDVVQERYERLVDRVRTRSPGGEPRLRRAGRRAAGRRGRGSQGRRHASAVRSCARQPSRALRAAGAASVRGRATS